MTVKVLKYLIIAASINISLAAYHADDNGQYNARGYYDCSGQIGYLSPYPGAQLDTLHQILPFTLNAFGPLTQQKATNLAPCLKIEAQMPKTHRRVPPGFEQFFPEEFEESKCPASEDQVAKPEASRLEVSKPTYSEMAQRAGPKVSAKAQPIKTDFRPRPLTTMPKSFDHSVFTYGFKETKSPEASSKAVFKLSKEVRASLGEFETELSENQNLGRYTGKFSYYFQSKDKLLSLLQKVPAKSLQKLTLHGDWVTDEFLASLTEYFAKSELEYLDLSYCSNITDRGLLSFISRFGKIGYLNLSSCRNVTDLVLVKLAETIFVSLENRFIREPKIRYLELEGCEQITDAGILVMAPYMKEFRILNLNNCVKLTDVSITAMASNLKEINSLHVKGCTRMTPQGLSLIVPFFKKLTKFEAPY